MFANLKIVLQKSKEMQKRNWEASWRRLGIEDLGAYMASVACAWKTCGWRQHVGEPTGAVVGLRRGSGEAPAGRVPYANIFGC